MKNFNTLPKRFYNYIFPLGIILIGVSSCTVSQTATRSNDGIYYDPSQEPEQEIVHSKSQPHKEASSYDEPIRIGGKYFDDNGNAPSYNHDPIAYEDNNVVKVNDYNEVYESDYIEWGEDTGTEVYINNYYGSAFYSPFYRPYYGGFFNFYRGYRFGFGFNSFYGYPFYPSFYDPYDPFFGPRFGYPYYGYPRYYNPYNPYYGSYNRYQPNRFYNNPYIRRVSRGKGNRNGVIATNRQQQIRPSVAEGIRRSDKVLKRVETKTQRNNSYRNNTTIRRSTDKIRVRQPKDNTRVRQNGSTEVRSSRDNSVRKRSNTPSIRRSNGTYSRPRISRPSKARPRAAAPTKRSNKTSTVQKNTNYNNSYKSSTPSYKSSSRTSSVSKTGNNRGIRRD